MIGQGGSRVLVTTRSENTAKIIRNGCTHNLKGLSRDNSWKLFKMTAFDDEGSNQRCVNHIKMMDIEEKIVGKCNNNPLAIKVMGSLLYGQDINKWRSFEESRLAKINNGDNQIMSVLKLSYYNLQPSLKSCFSYCAVFPKDFEINKVLLINLWKALGYIEPLNEGQSVEDVAEEHFKILLRRCFFHDVKKDECDEIESVKIHDLLHDVAQEVVGGEFQVLNSVDYTLGDRTRHVSIFDKSCFEASSGWSSVRKLIALVNIPCYYNMVEIPKDIKVGNWKSLRVLELACLGRGISLNSIGKLQHLRYLDLSRGDFEELPNSIAKLHNLQTLILDGCVYLRHLPHDFISLIKLSHLSLGSCMRLTGMPLGLDKLTRLRLLTDFVVGRKKNITEKQSDDELKDLGTLTNLTGSIWIEIGENYKNVQVMKDMSEGYLSKIADLKEVKISMGRESVEAEVAEDALEKLEPHPNLKKLVLNKYAGRTIPWWRRPKDNSPTVKLSNLVKVKIIDCDNLVSLPSFCKLHFLKLLELRNLKNLEYMETRSSLPEASDTTFFPSLETLQLQYCSKWEGGWFREEGSGGTLSFPCLSTLEISFCPELTSFPACPSVKSMKLMGVTTSQLMKNMMGIEGEEQEQGGDLTVGNHKSSSCLVDLRIEGDGEVESLSEYEKVFEMCASSLRNLSIVDCFNLSRFGRGLGHLTALEKICLLANSQLKFSEDNEEIMAWKPLHKSLHSLELLSLGSMTSLPKGMQYLTSLQTLFLYSCSQLEGLPEWISCLSSLQSLTISACDAMESLPEGIQTLTSLQTLTICYCRGLKERCREPDGKDWPKIQHIPNLSIK